MPAYIGIYFNKYIYRSVYLCELAHKQKKVGFYLNAFLRSHARTHSSTSPASFHCHLHPCFHVIPPGDPAFDFAATARGCDK